MILKSSFSLAALKSRQKVEGIAWLGGTVNLTQKKERKIKKETNTACCVSVFSLSVAPTQDVCEGVIVGFRFPRLHCALYLLITDTSGSVLVTGS